MSTAGFAIMASFAAAPKGGARDSILSKRWRGLSAEQPRILTEEQRAVVSADDKSFVVRASAGTGKTTTLVARYLRLITQDGLRPDQILTVTFTRKAAAEMKKRIVGALVANGLRDEAQIAETGPIQTIHGFCERVLRE